MFEIETQEGLARAGVLKTTHGKIRTPFFMPVATKVAVKHVTSEELVDIGVECIICNAFVLSLKPGTEIIQKAGGIHKYMNWDKGVFTDSGGFQVLSPDFLLGVSKRGVRFQDPYSLRKNVFTPEESIKIQNELGADVAMALDFVPAYGDDYEKTKKAIEITHKWADRCIRAHDNDKQLLFGIAQGGIYPDLRKISAKKIDGLDFDGVALGGICVGEPKEKMIEEVKIQTGIFAKNKLKYLMGVGSPDHILESIELGVDAFDSAYPTQIARRGCVFTSKGTIRINRARYREELVPIDEKCECYTCKNYTRSYVSYLLSVHESLGKKLATIHNLHFIQTLISGARKAIECGGFAKFKEEFMKE